MLCHDLRLDTLDRQINLLNTNHVYLAKLNNLNAKSLCQLPRYFPQRVSSAPVDFHKKMIALNHQLKVLLRVVLSHIQQVHE